jgi:hypothetical protein
LPAPPLRLKTPATIIPIMARPNRPKMTYRRLLAMLPENISIIAPIMATIGSTISICAHCRPPGSGTSGGASSNNSPPGSSGAGRRIGRRTTTVAIVNLHGFAPPRSSRA